MSYRDYDPDPIGRREKEMAQLRGLIEVLEDEINQALVKTSYGKIAYTEANKIMASIRVKRAEVNRHRKHINDLAGQIEHIKKHDPR